MPPITVVRSMPGIPSLMNHLPHPSIHVSQTDLRLATQGSAAPVMINNRGMSWDLLIKSTEQRTNQDRERVTSFDSQANTHTHTHDHTLNGIVRRRMNLHTPFLSPRKQWSDHINFMPFFMAQQNRSSSTSRRQGMLLRMIRPPVFFRVPSSMRWYADIRRKERRLIWSRHWFVARLINMCQRANVTSQCQK